jgi:hypothetical protein
MSEGPQQVIWRLWTLAHARLFGDGPWFAHGETYNVLWRKLVEAGLYESDSGDPDFVILTPLGQEMDARLLLLFLGLDHDTFGEAARLAATVEPVERGLHHIFRRPIEIVDVDAHVLVLDAVRMDHELQRGEDSLQLFPNPAFIALHRPIPVIRSCKVPAEPSAGRPSRYSAQSQGFLS